MKNTVDRIPLKCSKLFFLNLGTALRQKTTFFTIFPQIMNENVSLTLLRVKMLNKGLQRIRVFNIKIYYIYVYFKTGNFYVHLSLEITFSRFVEIEVRAARMLRCLVRVT